MKCPHCLQNFHDSQALWSVYLGRDADQDWNLKRRHCPCGHFVLDVENGQVPLNAHPGSPIPAQGTQHLRMDARRTFRVWPKGAARTPLPEGVPPEIAEDYREAALVLADSAKASAALSRRCLQHLLRTTAGIRHGNLNDEIQQVLDSKQLPSIVAESIDAVRAIGNFAAHPIKSTSTGEIVDVEPNEAEWNLDVLDSLFDFYYVLPAKAEEKKEALNKKLQDAAKPNIK
jgi:hypothetical protein